MCPLRPSWILPATPAMRPEPDGYTWLMDFDNLAGTFTYKDGRKMTLTNGIGGNAGQQWRPYPSVFAPDIFSEDIPVIPTLD